MADPLKVINDIIAAQDQLGDFIANGPDDGLPGFVRNQYRDRCNEFANVPNWAKNLNPIGQLSFGRFCRPYWDSQGVDGPSQQLPFEGGQCLTAYLVNISAPPGPQPGTGVNANNWTTGPVVGYRIEETATQTIGYLTSNSGPRALSQCPNPSVDGIAERVWFTVQKFERGSFSLAIQNQCVGAPASCGDPPPELLPGPNPPPNPGPNPEGDPVDDPDGGPIPTIPLPPYEDPVGGPTEIDPGPEPGGGGGEPTNPPNATGGDGLPGDGDAVGGAAGGAAGGEDGEEVDFGEPPAGKVWVGALIECTVDSRLGNIPGTGPTNTVYPTAIANASLKYSVGYGTSATIRSKWTELVRPVTALVVEGCFVQAQPGVTASVRPISATICPENPCEQE